MASTGEVVGLEGLEGQGARGGIGCASTKKAAREEDHTGLLLKHKPYSVVLS